MNYSDWIWVYDLAIQDGETEIAGMIKKLIKKLFPEIVKEKEEKC